MIGSAATTILPWIGLGFVGLAFIEGSMTFLSGRWAAQTAEGITRRLRNYLFDHIQHLSFTYHSKMETGELIERSTSDVDALRRFFADQAIGIGRIILLFIINFIAIINLSLKLALISVAVVPLIVLTSVWFFQTRLQGLRSLSGAGSDPIHHPTGEPDRRARGESFCPPGP